MNTQQSDNAMDRVLDVLYMQGEQAGEAGYNSATHQIASVNGAKQHLLKWRDEAVAEAKNTKGGEMKVLTKVLVGSRLHGLNTEDSDYDYRGIHIHDLKEVLSPFNTVKNTSWIEGDEDNTSYELADFCKQAVHGNATILEVFFSDKIIETSPIAEKMRTNWVKFMDSKRFVAASRGYAHNQWNKFYNFEDVGGAGQQRTAKFAVAFLRVMWQCEQFLLTGEFKCDLSESDLYRLLKKIKPLSIAEIKPCMPEIITAMGELDRRVSIAMSESKFMGYEPDIKWIEEFIYEAYRDNG